jgi:hypothetical protein
LGIGVVGLSHLVDMAKIEQIPHKQAQEIQKGVDNVVSTLVNSKIKKEKISLTPEQISGTTTVLNKLATSLWQARSNNPGSTERTGIKKLKEELGSLGISNKDAGSIFQDIDSVIRSFIPSSTTAKESTATAEASSATGTAAAAQSTTETETTAKTTAAAEPKETTEANPIPDQLSTLLFNLVSSRDPAQIQNAVLLIHKLQQAEQTPSESSITPEKLAESLTNLQNLNDNPEELKTAIETLNNETLSALKNAVGDHKLNENIHLLKALLEHGPVVNSYAQVDSRYQDTVDKMLSRLKPAENITDPKSYAQTLGDFKGAIHSALEEFRKTCNTVEGLDPRIAFNQIKNAERKLNQNLGKITETYDQKIAKADLEIIQKAFSEARETTKQDSSARNLLETWTQKIFTAEGAVAATMLVPFLANILAGTLGEIPLIGEMVKSIAGFTSSMASSAQGLIQMLNTLNQTKTAQAVAELKNNRATLAPAEASKTVAA